jgi:hypothetical protein
MRLHLQWGRWWAASATLLALVGSAPAAQAAGPTPAGVALKANLASGQPVGTTITWTASSTGLGNPVYRFSVGTPGGPSHVVRDFSLSPTFSWTPMHEGVYSLQAQVKDGFAATGTTRAAATFTVNARVTGTKAVVRPTANPLVALYSAPACAGGTLAVQFRPATGSATWQSTAAQPCSPGQRVNVLVAGMRPGTRYLLRHVVSGGSRRATSSPLPFTTGKPPAGLKITSFTVKQAPSAQALPNGNLTFAGGFAPPSKEVEVRPDGTKVYELDSAVAVYRAYRLTGLSF